jgi:chromate transporter
VIESPLQPPRLTYAALFLRFLKFGLFAFGGPVAQIAMIRHALVDEEKWIESERFNRLLAVMQILPGPEAHELCVHLGIRAKGRLGGVLAGLGFMLPGLILMLALAWAYTRLPWAGSPLAAALFLGMQAAVLAVILRALHRIGVHILQDRCLSAIAIGAAGATFAGASFWLVLLAAGAVYAAGARRRFILAATVLLFAGSAALLLVSEAQPPTDSQAVAPLGAPALFWTGLKGGLLTFGGAYTAIPFIRSDTVGRGTMSDAQFLDGVALAGILPAPLVIFATFVGWISGGPMGALAITAGMFLPAFSFSLLFYERLEALTEHRRLRLFLDGVAAGVLGLIAITFLDLARALAERTPSLTWSGATFMIGLAVLLVWKSKLAVPAVLAIGASLGAAMLV